MAKMIVLAAGQGTRLSPHTDDKPKCLVQIHGKPLLEWQLEVARSAGITDIAVVRGYKGEAINYPGVRYFTNSRFSTTNMVETLWCAEPSFGEDIIVSYGDIIYEAEVMRALLGNSDPIAVVVDKGWESYWSARFDDVLADAETLEMNQEGEIVEIGQKPESSEKIEGQYIGLMAFRREGVAALRALYEKAKLDGNNGRFPLRGQRSFENLYMTDILQGLIDEGVAVKAVEVNRGWLEIDSPEDLRVGERLVDRHSPELSIAE